MNRSDSHSGERLLCIRDVAARLGISSRKAWRLVHTDPRFPRPVRVGGRGTRFLESALNAYIVALAGAKGVA